MKQSHKSILKRLSTIGLAVSSTLLIAGHVAMAATTLGNIQDNLTPVGSAGFGDSTTTGDRLPIIIGKYISQALALLGIILVVIIIYAGFQWMTAQGDVEKVKTAKKMIGQAVVGMAIILAAYAITNFVVNAVVNGTTP